MNHPTVSPDASSPAAAPESRERMVHVEQAPPRKSRVWAAYIGFFVAVFASMAAAATVASSDMPLMVVGL